MYGINQIRTLLQYNDAKNYQIHQDSSFKNSLF